jgi:hypothetical protein
MRRIELKEGDVFNYLTIVKRAESKVQPSGQRKSMYECKCKCGNIIVSQYYHLKSGHTKSCGCEKGDCGRKETHGHWVGNKPTREWITWHAMKGRCYNKNRKCYKWYGAKGVIVCDRWLDSFENFYADMGDKPTIKHSIDRINPFGNYEPTNCKWATAKEQANNKRKNYAEIH